MFEPITVALRNGQTVMVRWHIKYTKNISYDKKLTIIIFFGDFWTDVNV